MARLVVFASGRGSNFRSIYQKSQEKYFRGEIVGLITDNTAAPVIEFANLNNIPVAVVTPKEFSSADLYGMELLARLQKMAPDYIILAGFLKKIPDLVIQKYPMRVLNIHPALLPAFGGKGMYGKYVHQAVYDSGVKVSGVTIHFVTSDYDAGPILMQRCVDISECQSPEEIATKVLRTEHEIYPRAIKLVLENDIEIMGKRVVIQKRKKND